MSAKKSLAEKVLDYWFSIEFLSQDKYPSSFEVQNRVEKIKKDYERGESKYKSTETFIPLTPQNIKSGIYQIVRNEAIACGMRKWGNLTFYIGKVKREKCIESISRVLPFEAVEEDRPEKNTDSIAMVSLQLSPEGKYIEKSLSLSTVIWALNAIKNEKGNLSEVISSSRYHMTIAELEEKHFDENKIQKLMEKDDNQESVKEIPGNNGEELLQTFAVESITWNEIKSLYNDVFSNYIKDNIELTDGEDDVQEVYGLSFQMFADEKTKEFKEDDNYLGLNHDYFSDDIQMVLNKLKSGSLKSDGFMGQDLIKYIEIYGEKEDAKNRIDLVRPKDKGEFLRELVDILCINNAPLGKWPSRFMPALMQQVAINFAINKGTTPIFEENGKVFSVNGPPGTGKTTLLKEIVVSNIVERTILLAKYDNPDDAFVTHKFMNGTKEDHAYSSYTRRWYSLADDEINNYSMLVTSCNNAAVENISKELPQTMIKDLMPLNDDPEELKEILSDVASLFNLECAKDEEVTRNGFAFKDIYFSRYAAQLFEREDVWGLIAAPLGKKSNIKSFYYNALSPILYDFYVTGSSAKERTKRYHESRKQFLIQVDIVKQLKEKLNRLNVLQQQMHKKWTDYQKIFNQNNQIIDVKNISIQGLTAQVQDLVTSIYEKEKVIEELSLKISSKNIRKQEINDEISELDQVAKQLLEKKVEVCDRVNWFTKIFKRKKYDAVMEMAEEYENDAQKKKRQKTDLENEMKALVQEMHLLQNDISKVQEKQKELESEKEKKCLLIGGIKQEIVLLRTQIEKNLEMFKETKQIYHEAYKKNKETGVLDSVDPLDDQYVEDILSCDVKLSTKAQVANPWLSQRYNREREKLFAYAMTMNKNFVLSSNHCRDNFITLSHYWGIRPGDDKHKITFSYKDVEAMVPALYQTLFLLVPVISSTFASVGRLFKDAKQAGILGILVVDEAGQAQPQMAVGALYRSRRAIIVGDPKQVEPVVTNDLNLLKKVYSDEDLGRYKEKNISVQIFADRMNSIGTYLDNGSDYPEWVGSPLLVHRRCISPMYDISNRISYNGIMKQQTNPPKRELEEKFILDKSCWINIEGKEQGNKNHFVKEQGEKVCDLLEKAFSKNPEPNIYIISPFTTVVDGIKKYINTYCKKYPMTNIDSDYLTGYEQKRIGTVHTFQGKEADEVIFLLGCDCSDDCKGAITWVNENIVNVAATRAKYRLYVIGDMKAWSKSACVSIAKDLLDNYK